MRSSRLRLDHYRTLGLAYDANKSEIRSAFLRMAKTHHPDANGSSASVKRFQDVAEAHSVLSKEESKASYDRQIGNDGLRMERAAAFHRSQQGPMWTRPPPKRPTAPPHNGRAFNHQEWDAWHYGNA